jgi:hypothetical protein
MIIVAAGDSMVWGSELQDSPHGGPNGYSRRTFTALLSDQDYICVAYPGISNQEIAVRTRLTVSSDRPDVVIVCWTWPTRDNVTDSDDTIIGLQHYLELLQIPYLFTCVDNCIVTDNPKINWNNWYLFPPGSNPSETAAPRGFYQWAVENKYNIGSDGHPLEDAHQDAAILIKEKFNELVKKYY